MSFPSVEAAAAQPRRHRAPGPSYDPTVSAPPEKIDRHTRRRAQTRAKLVEAARATFARQGVDATRINEITEEADVGFGSFYNHFDSKDAIAAAVVEESAAAAAEAIDVATRGLDDPAEVVAVAHRSIIARAAEDPDWGWLLVRLEISHGLASATLGPYAARDLQRGIEAGRFRVDDPDVALLTAGGALVAVVRAVLEGRADDATPRYHAACVLRIFGVPPEIAAEVAARPLPNAP
jgi:AcrR family transcriptional regulator